LIIDLNNIHGFNTLNYILQIFSKKIDMSLIGILYHAYAQRGQILSHGLILTKKDSICQYIILETPSKTQTSFANEKIYNYQLH